MNAQEIIAKADRGEGLTEEEIRVYREAVKPVKHTYGKYGTLAKKYLEEENIGKYWAIVCEALQRRTVSADGKLYGGLPQADRVTEAHRGRNPFRACVCGLRTEVQDESCFGNREGVAESVVYRNRRCRGVSYELHWRNYLCDYGMRGGYGKERRNAAPSCAPELRGAK